MAAAAAMTAVSNVFSPAFCGQTFGQRGSVPIEPLRMPFERHRRRQNTRKH
jgi:hypothetical protein